MRGGVARQRLQRLGVAQAAVTRAAQAVELHGDAPARAAGTFGHARAGRRCDGQRQAGLASQQPVVAGLGNARQARVFVKHAGQCLAILQLQPIGRAGSEPGAQLEWPMLVAGQQGRNGLARLLVERAQARFDLLAAFGRQAEAGQHGAQDFGGDALMMAVGVDPVDRQPGRFGQAVKGMLDHCAPSR